MYITLVLYSVRRAPERAGRGGKHFAAHSCRLRSSIFHQTSGGALGSGHRYTQQPAYGADPFGSRAEPHRVSRGATLIVIVRYSLSNTVY